MTILSKTLIKLGSLNLRGFKPPPLPSFLTFRFRQIPLSLTCEMRSTKHQNKSKTQVLEFNVSLSVYVQLADYLNEFTLHHIQEYILIYINLVLESRTSKIDFCHVVGLIVSKTLSSQNQKKYFFF